MNKIWRMAMLSAALTLGACSLSGFVHDEKLVGPYRLVAVDIDEDMAICWSMPNGDCVGDGLPGPTVFAAGFNEKFLVAAVHPSVAGNNPDKSITNFYYVIRPPDEVANLPHSDIKGPFNEAAFNREKTRLGLPEFTRMFDHLR